MFVLLITYVAYVLYHSTRKPISVVKNELIDCAEPTNASVVVVCDSWISKFMKYFLFVLDLVPIL